MSLVGQRVPAGAASTLLLFASQLNQRLHEACGCADSLRRAMYRTVPVRPPASEQPCRCTLPQHRCKVRLYASKIWRCCCEQRMALACAFTQSSLC